MTAAHYKGGHYKGNDLGLHHTALPPIVASCPYSDQLLVTRKFWSPGANRPSQAKAECGRQASLARSRGYDVARSRAGPPDARSADRAGSESFLSGHGTTGMAG